MSILKRHISAIIAFLLVVTLFITSEPFRIVSAAAGEDIRLSKLYLKEVKMFYGLTEADARKSCESEGYIFCPTDLNEGSPKTASIGSSAVVESGSKDIYMGIYLLFLNVLYDSLANSYKQVLMLFHRMEYINTNDSLKQLEQYHYQ